MRGRISMTPQQVKTAAGMYRDAKLSIYSIGGRLGIPPETVRLNLIKAGVAMRTAADGQRASAERQRASA